MRRTIAGDDDSLSRLMAREVGKLVSQAKPWAILPLLLAWAWLMHHFWPGGWTGMGVVGAGIILTGLVIHVHHARTHIGRFMYPVLSLAAPLWMAWVAWQGIHVPQMGVWFIGGITASLCWGVWVGAHDSQPDVVTTFETGAQRAGLTLRLRNVQIHPRKLTGRIDTVPGEITHDELVKQVGRIEAGRELPPGSVSITPDLDNASRHHITISDPRLLRKPQLWPGPSRPGQSIADPVRCGVWQDGDDADVVATGYHTQIMGATGAGKSETALWGEVAETVTRTDAAVVLFDVTKGRQFGGPLEPCLHRLITDPAEALDWTDRLHEARLARTNWLETVGQTRWVPGCGLTHLTVWYEECPDYIDLVDRAGRYEQWESDVKAMRSAGMRIVLSLQRSDYTQMPTLVRGQLAKQCFGVLNSADADFGLSTYQSDHDCRPELWGASQPGMCFLDTPTLPEARKTMPMRGWYWGPDTRLIAAHAAAWPAENRPLDHITAPILFPGTAGTVLPVTVDVPAHLRNRIPRQPVRLVETGAPAHPGSDDDFEGELEETDDMFDRNQPREPDADDPIEIPDGHPAAGHTFSAGPAVRMALSPEDSRAAFRERLAELAARGQRQFTIEDVMDVREQVGRSRAWLYAVLDELVADQTLRLGGGFPRSWVIQRVAA